MSNADHSISIDMSFWNTLKNRRKDGGEVFFAMAPMEDVTDTVFRQIISGCGAPNVFFTEFTNVEGLFSGNGAGFDVVSKRLKFAEVERPIVAQVWGLSPENYCKAARLAVERGFDGIDINMGCPYPAVIKNCGGAALIKDPDLAREIVEAVMRGVENSAKEMGGKRIGVSVKTRIGFDRPAAEEWIGFLLKLKVDALTVHGRTAKQSYTVPADWETIKISVGLRDKISPDTLIIGNGDIKNLAEGREKAQESGVDGVMIGRGVFGNPWVFNSEVEIEKVTVQQRLDLLLKHVALFEKTWGESKNFAILKKFFKLYVQGFNGASELRAKLMETKQADEVVSIINAWENPKLS